MVGFSDVLNQGTIRKNGPGRGKISEIRPSQDGEELFMESKAGRGGGVAGD
jgi:hypothetical protein